METRPILPALALILVMAPVSADSPVASLECLTRFNLDLVTCEGAGKGASLARPCVETATATFFHCTSELRNGSELLAFGENRSFAFVVDGADECQCFPVRVENPGRRPVALNVLNGSIAGHLGTHGAQRIVVRLDGTARTEEFEGWSHVGRVDGFLPPGEHDVTVEVCGNDGPGTPFAMVFFDDGL